MTYRDKTETLAVYRSSTEAAEYHRKQYHECSSSLFGGEYRAMLLRLVHNFEAQAQDAALFLGCDDGQEAA